MLTFPLTITRGSGSDFLFHFIDLLGVQAEPIVELNGLLLVTPSNLPDGGDGEELGEGEDRFSHLCIVCLREMLATIEELGRWLVRSNAVSLNMYRS